MLRIFRKILKLLSWIIFEPSRISTHLRRQMLAPTNTLYGIVSAVARRARLTTAAQSEKGDKMLCGVYDTNRNPITFDFVYFLATLASLANGRDFSICIIKRSFEVFQVEEMIKGHLSDEDYHWRLHNILLPLTSLFEKCTSVYLVENYEDLSGAIKVKTIFPERGVGNYFPVFSYKDFYRLVNTFGANLTPPARAKRYVEDWIEAGNYRKDLITVTLRQYSFDRERNSNLAEWKAAADWLRLQGYDVVIVPDTEASFEKFDEGVFAEPCWNIGLRAALYEKASLNFFVSSGVNALAQLNPRVNYVIMKFFVPNSITADVDALSHGGHLEAIDSDRRRFNFSKVNVGAYQIVSFEEDSLVNIQREFRLFREFIEETKL